MKGKRDGASPCHVPGGTSPDFAEILHDIRIFWHQRGAGTPRTIPIKASNGQHSKVKLLSPEVDMRGDIDHAPHMQSRSPPTIPALHASTTTTPDQKLTRESGGYQGEGELHSWAKKRGNRMSKNIPGGSWMPHQLNQLPPHLSSQHIQPLGLSDGLQDLVRTNPGIRNSTLPMI